MCRFFTFLIAVCVFVYITWDYSPKIAESDIKCFTGTSYKHLLRTLNFIENVKLDNIHIVAVDQNSYDYLKNSGKETELVHPEGNVKLDIIQYMLNRFPNNRYILFVHPSSILDNINPLPFYIDLINKNRKVDLFIQTENDTDFFIFKNTFQNTKIFDRIDPAKTFDYYIQNTTLNIMYF
jgi:hypothetical protein